MNPKKKKHRRLPLEEIKEENSLENLDSVDLPTQRTDLQRQQILLSELRRLHESNLLRNLDKLKEVIEFQSEKDMKKVQGMKDKLPRNFDLRKFVALEQRLYLRKGANEAEKKAQIDFLNEQLSLDFMMPEVNEYGEEIYDQIYNDDTVHLLKGLQENEAIFPMKNSGTRDVYQAVL